MSDRIIDLEPDEAPKNGVWVDTCDVLANPTEQELEDGRRAGEETDPDVEDVEYDPDEDDPLPGLSSFGSGGGTRNSALAKARKMKEILLEHGVPEVKIELRMGRPSSYGRWDSGFFVADMSHHTVSRYGSNKTPVLSLCMNGRSDLPGPLCNGYGGWDLCYRIITFGYANHPGYGGPIVVPALTAGKFRIPKDSARRYAWGTEWEGGLSARDWDRKLTNPRTGDRMTFREFMGRSNAGLEKALEIHENAHLEHSTWTNRKIDRLGYNANRGIREKKKYRDGEERLSMAITRKTLRKIMREEIRNQVGFAGIRVDLNGKGGKDDVVWSLNSVLRRLLNDEGRVKAAIKNIEVDTTDLAAELAPLLQTEGKVTVEKLEEAINNVLQKGVK